MPEFLINAWSHPRATPRIRRSVLIVGHPDGLGAITPKRRYAKFLISGPLKSAALLIIQDVFDRDVVVLVTPGSHNARERI